MASQTNFKIEDEFLLFEDAITKEPVLMYNDSTLATGFNFTKSNIRTSFPKNLERNYFNSYQFNIKEKNYLVDGGCGPVVHYQNTKFTRIDKSFLHKNQYNAIPFQYKNEIYLWGGYGLFSYKNILTKFNFKTQEWGDITQNFENEIPPVQSSKTYVKTKDKIYLFGGKTLDYKNVVKSKYLSEIVWEFNIKTNTWKETGKHNLEKFINIKDGGKVFTFQRKNKTIILKEDLLEIDIDKDRIQLFLQRNYKNLAAVVYHEKTDQISYVYKKSNGQLVGVTEDFVSFRGDLIGEDSFYAPRKIKYELWGGLLLGILVLVGIFYKRKRNQHTLVENKIVYNKTTDTFSFNRKALKNLSEPKKRMLKILMQNQEAFLPLNALNEAITEDPKNDSYGAIKKRREIFLKELGQEFSLLLAIDRNAVFETQKNSTDRRIKEIRLKIEIEIR
ncbi:kelch motif-containing protein [Polaribacter sp.]|nr:kelch motif-containing protein [Polaribacter sp.]